MRLINADELIEKSWDVDCRIGYVQVVDVGDILESPTIDAVEVVRCKDCYLWDRSWQLIETKPELRNCRKLRTITREDWFCAEGKRDEQDLP